MEQRTRCFVLLSMIWMWESGRLTLCCMSQSEELHCAVTLAVWNVTGGRTFGFGSLCLPSLNVLAGGSC